VGIIGIAHSDEHLHYKHVAGLGRYWNAIVAVSAAIKNNIAAANPSLSSRLSVIPYGVDLLNEVRGSRPGGNALRIIYSGRLVTRQKRVLDLPAIMESLLAQGVPAELSIVGCGQDQLELMTRCYTLIGRGAVRFYGSVSNVRTCELYDKHDVFLLTSDFEGLPVSVLEAMAHGCVPVVSDIPSGIPELVKDGVNGFRVRVGDTEAFAARLALLYREPNRRDEIAANARHTISDGGYRSEDIAPRYQQLCGEILHQARTGKFVRPRGPIVPPPSLRKQMSWKSHLPRPIRIAYWQAREVVWRV
jgi:glycosyltransferase involved in cell wall biosynthesis